MPEEEGSKSGAPPKLQWATLIVTNVIAILSALYAGYVSLKTKDAETRSQAQIASMQTEAQSLITIKQLQGQLALTKTQNEAQGKINTQQLSTQKAITDKQRDTEHAIAAANVETQLKLATVDQQTKNLATELQNSVQRAQVFKDLIGDLNDHQKSSTALLVLWTLYPKDRNVIVAAALNTKDEAALNTLIQLGKGQVESYLRNARATHDPEVIRSVNKILASLESTTDAMYYINRIQTDEVYSLYAYTEPLVVLVKKSREVKRTVKELSLRNTERRIVFWGILFAAGEPAALDTIITLLRRNPQDIDLLLTISTPNLINKDVLTKLVQIGIEIISLSNSDPERLLGALRLTWLPRKWDLDISDSLKKRIGTNLAGLIRNPDVSYKVRNEALDELEFYFPEICIAVVSEVLTKSGRIGINMAVNSLLDGTKEHPGLRDRYPDLKLPEANAAADIWLKWRQEHQDFLQKYSGP